MRYLRLIQNVLIAAALGISLVMLMPPTSPLLGSTEIRVFTTRSEDGPPIPPTPEPVNPKPRPEPVEAKGLMMTGLVGGGQRFETLLDLVRRTELNTVVLDIKNEGGDISWETESDWASMAGAGQPKMRDPEERIQRLRDEGIYVIGRIVVFQDPPLAEARPDLAVRDVAGGIWQTHKGLAWTDPYSTEVWQYNIEIAKEAIELGFQEIQWDYVRFPSDGDTDRIWYPHRDERHRAEVIRDFLREAHSQLAPLGVYTSADVFGLVTLFDHDMGIGQRLGVMANEVDYISPMIYPSHYEAGNYGLDDPEAEPYETILRSTRDALQRIEGTGAIYRPWIQDFSLRVRYGPEEVRAQIRALEEEGVSEWLVWNAANRYTEEALRPAGGR